MPDTRPLFRWGLVLALLTIVVIGATTYYLYRTALANERASLFDAVSAYATLIESVARFDRQHSADYPAPPSEFVAGEGAEAATLAQIREAFSQHPGLGGSGELVLGARGEDSVVVLHQRGLPEQPARVPVESRRAEPMRRALRGQSGTIVAADYAGTTVLAAFHPIPDTGWGLVFKRDLAAIRAPYAQVALVSTGFGIGLVALAALLFGRASDPLIRALRRSEARWGQLFDYAGEGIIVTDVEGRLEFVNPRARELFGVAQNADLEGISAYELLPEADHGELRRHLEARAHGRSERYEWTLHGENGERTLRVHGTPLPGPDGRIEGAMALIEDVTDPRRAQEALEAERRLLRGVLDLLPVAVAVVDTEGRIPLHNPAAETIWERDESEWSRLRLGSPEFKGWDVATGSPIGPDEWMAARTLRDGVTVEDQVVEIEAADGTRRILRNASLPLYDDEDRIEKVVAASQDITEERRVQAALRRERELLDRVLDTLPIGVWVADANGQLIRHNPAGEAIWRGAHYEGGQAAYAEYKGWWADTGEEIAPEDWAVARAVNKGETSLNEVIDIQCFDGSRRTILNSAVPMFAEDGSIQGAIFVNEDITQRRAMERMLRRNEELLSLVLESLPVGVAVADEQGHFILSNKADTAIWEGNRVGAAAGDTAIRGIRRDSDIDAAVEAGDWPIQRALDQRRSVLDDVVEVKLASGQVKTLVFYATPILADDGALWGAAEIVQDITVRTRIETERRKLADALRHTADAVFLMDAGGCIEYVNPAFERITGFDLEACRGRRPEEMLDAGQQPEGYYRDMWHTVGRGEVFRDVLVSRHRDGHLFQWEKTLSPLLDSEGSLVSVIGIATDITAQREFQDRLHRATRFDPLTQLPNRALLLERLGEALGRLKWSHRSLALALLDLQNFTIVNDSLGHDAGDEVLREVGRRLAACVREGDQVARVGNDGFAVLLDRVARDVDAPSIIHEMHQALRGPLQIGAHSVPIDAHIGVSLAPADASEPQTLYQNADTALAQAKREGAASARFYAPDMAARAQRQLAIHNGLRQALDEGGFELHYQPQIDLATGRLRGAEALLRWQHPELGPIGPDEFIPVAEQNRLILPIGEWVLRQALQQLSDWQAAGLAPGRVCVNLSPVQLVQQDLTASVQEALMHAGQAPGNLELEITETALMRDFESGIVRLQALNGLGIRLAVDDFGTGHSSLAYLSRLPLDTLKIDRSFVRGLEHHKVNASIVLSVVSLAKALSLDVVAEGVETAEELDFLRRHGCDAVQGYYLGRPMPASDFAALLERDHWL